MMKLLAKFEKLCEEKQLNLTQDQKEKIQQILHELQGNSSLIEILRQDIIITPHHSILNDLDKILGDCGPGPIDLKGYIKMSDGYGPVYICIWNPILNPNKEIPRE